MMQPCARCKMVVIELTAEKDSEIARLKEVINKLHEIREKEIDNCEKCMGRHQAEIASLKELLQEGSNLYRVELDCSEQSPLGKDWLKRAKEMTE